MTPAMRSILDAVSLKGWTLDRVFRVHEDHGAGATTYVLRHRRGRR